VNVSLEGCDWLLGDTFSAADIQMSFIGEVAGSYGKRSAYPSLDAWVRRMQDRPAYRKALARGGAYRFAG